MANKSCVIRQNVIRKSETVYSNVELSKFYVTVRVATTWCAREEAGDGRQRQLGASGNKLLEIFVLYFIFIVCLKNEVPNVYHV